MVGRKRGNSEGKTSSKKKQKSDGSGTSKAVETDKSPAQQLSTITVEQEKLVVLESPTKASEVFTEETVIVTPTREGEKANSASLEEDVVETERLAFDSSAATETLVEDTETKSTKATGVPSVFFFFVVVLLSVVSWDFHSNVLPRRAAAAEVPVLCRNIVQEFYKGPRGLDMKDRHYFYRPAAEVVAKSVEEQKEWLDNVRAARQKVAKPAKQAVVPPEDTSNPQEGIISSIVQGIKKVIPF